MQPSHRHLPILGALLCLAALIAACGGQSPATPGPEQSNAPAEPAAPSAQPTATEFTSPAEQDVSPLPTPTEPPEADKGVQAVSPVPFERVPSTPAPVTGEVPQELLDAVFDDLVERLNVEREAIGVEQGEYVIWRDGSLGCPQPGMMYTMALVPGYRIVLRVSDETFDYHASEVGYFFLCEGGLAEEPLPPGRGVDPSPDE